VGFSGFKFPLNAKQVLLVYTINFNGMEVGSLKVYRKSAHTTFYYSFISQVDYTFVKHFDIRFDIQSCFKEGNLVESYFCHKVNGATKSDCKLEKEDKGYKVTTGERAYKLLTNSVKYSITTLYFQEPLKIRKVFSERYAQFLPIKKLEGHQYVIIMPGGRENYYKFSEGICKEVNVDIPFGKLQFELQSN